MIKDIKDSVITIETEGKADGEYCWDEFSDAELMYEKCKLVGKLLYAECLYTEEDIEAIEHIHNLLRELNRELDHRKNTDKCYEVYTSDEEFKTKDKKGEDQCS